MRDQQRRRLRLVVSPLVAVTLVFIVDGLRNGRSLAQVAGFVGLEVALAAVIWLIVWEATTPDGQSRGTDRSDQ
ncbi:MAG: hypothetical protein JNK12_11835 [Acidimicrobiales bacterium]|nr:hypothetical protein [Acidimicrobiales bacterium]